MPMPQYNGPTYGYNPYQTYLPQSPWQGPQPYTQPQTAQLPVQQVQTQANPPLVGHIVTANDQIPVSEVPQNGTPAYFPMQDGRRDHVERRHSRATQAHQGESHQVVDHVDRLMRR